MNAHEAQLWDALEGGVRCRLCPNACTVAEGKSGYCGVRMNVGGKLVTTSYGRPIATHIDPIEKKPLFHFLPASRIYSIGTLGCNLKCLFCQNDSLSHPTADELEDYGASHVTSPEAIVREARAARCPSVAFTYNEPTVFFEMALEASRLARQNGMRSVMVSNGYISAEAIDALYPTIDAANIDLKGFSDDYYRRVCRAPKGLAPVLDAIQRIHERHPHVWLELTTLVLPGENDGMGEIAELSRWVRDHLGDSAVLHLSRFFPKHLMRDKPPTPVSTLVNAKKTAIDAGVPFVYVGNVSIPHGEDTYCPACKALVVSRDGYDTSVSREFDLTTGTCKCGAKIPGVWH